MPPKHKDAFIGLGANIGEPLEQLQQAVRELEETPGILLMAASSIYQSLPLGPQDQPDFFNACLHLRTDIEPYPLLGILKDIEARMGRRLSRRWGERCIDLDLLLLGETELTSSELTLPHPGMHERAFVLKPLAELVSTGFKMPDGRELGKLLSACPEPDAMPSGIRLVLGTPAQPEHGVQR